ncbi:MAG: hypothetical protein H7Y02_07055 [Candidatus Obscuribacterales bacterium]|nr:hypothetical protein [Steroidobacteraceae bacterium]
MDKQKTKNLEAQDVEIAATIRAQQPDGLSLVDEQMPGGGFNPYDSSLPVTKPRLPAHNDTFNFVPPLEKPKTTQDLRKLGQWLAMRKRLAEKGVVD